MASIASKDLAEERVAKLLEADSFTFELEAHETLDDTTLKAAERDISDIITWLKDAVDDLLKASDVGITNGRIQLACLDVAPDHCTTADLRNLFRILCVPQFALVFSNTLLSLAVPLDTAPDSDSGMYVEVVSTNHCGLAWIHNPRTHATVGILWHDRNRNITMSRFLLEDLCQYRTLLFHPVIHACLYTRALVTIYIERAQTSEDDLDRAQMESGFFTYSDVKSKDTADDLDLADLSRLACGANINIAFLEQSCRALRVLLLDLIQQNRSIVFDDDRIPVDRIASAREVAVKKLAWQLKQIDYTIEVTQVWQRQAAIVTQGIFTLITQRELRTNLEIAKDSKRLAEQSQRIAEESKKDTTSMEAIAAVTMFFLPATFVASFLDMPIFEINSDTGRLVTRQMWLFWVITIPLTIATIASWLMWTTLSARKRREQRVLDETVVG